MTKAKVYTPAAKKSHAYVFSKGWIAQAKLGSVHTRHSLIEHGITHERSNLIAQLLQAEAFLQAAYEQLDAWGQVTYHSTQKEKAPIKEALGKLLSD